MQSVLASLTLILATLASMPHATSTPLAPTHAIVRPPEIAARLIVGTSTYPITLAHEQPVFEAMRTLASTTAFRFTWHEYPGMGAFIDSIDGRPNSNGRYWILWMNGRKSTTGASNLIVHPGDTIEWKYERSY